MNSDGTYLSEESRLAVARVYICHELKKVDPTAVEEMAGRIANRTTAEHAAIFRGTMPGIARNGEHPDTRLLDLPCLDLWKLFHAISYGGFSKALHNCVGHPDFTWDLREVCLDLLLLETRVGILSGAPGGGSPLALQTALDYTRALDKIRLEQSLADYDRTSIQNRTLDPLIGRHRGDGSVLVHDGNGRIARICACMALGLDAPSKVSIWVGTERTRDPMKYAVYEACCSTVFATSSAD
jgi:hypothetical protein